MLDRMMMVVLAMLAVAPAQAQADLTLAERALDLDWLCGTPAGWQRVDAPALDTMRGGFTTPAGLAMSLGIDRQVSINGEVVSHTNFQIASVGNISSDEARKAHDAISTVHLVQNGANNFAMRNPAAGGGGTFVQNTLNGQTISSQTVINSSVNSMSLMKDMNFQAGLRDAAIRAVGTH